MKINNKNLQRIKDHAISEWPNECVGVVVNRTYKKLENISDDPGNEFKINPMQFEKMIKGAKQHMLIHSHPYDTAGNVVQDRYHRYLKVDYRTPSASDMRLSQSLGDDVPFGIVACTSEYCSDILIINESDDDKALIGNSFIHGVYDCWTAVRLYYLKTLDIELPNPPRDFNWWYQDDALEINHYHLLDDLGFFEVEDDDVQEHDIILYAIDTDDLINHAAVVLPNNMIYHHLYGQLSCREYADKYYEYQMKIMRHIDCE